MVLDSNYKNIASKEAAEKRDIEFITEKEGKYLIRIVGEKESGHFKIKITSKDEFKASYKDFWK